MNEKEERNKFNQRPYIKFRHYKYSKTLDTTEIKLAKLNKLATL